MGNALNMKSVITHSYKGLGPQKLFLVYPRQLIFPTEAFKALEIPCCQAFKVAFESVHLPSAWAVLPSPGAARKGELRAFAILQNPESLLPLCPPCLL